MAREAIDLGTPARHRQGYRWSRMVKGKRWTSSVFPSTSRENQRAAWGEFVQWREQQAIQSKGNSPAQTDEMASIRDFIHKQVTVLLDHALLTDAPEEAAKWRQILAKIPEMDKDDLLEMTRLTVGRDQGGNYSQVINDRAKTVERLKRSTDPDLTARKLADEYVEKLRLKAKSKRGSYGEFGKVKAALKMFVEWYGPEKSMGTVSEKTIREYTAFLESQVDSQKISRTTGSGYQSKFRTWLEMLATDEYPDDVPLPKNIRSKTQRIPAERKEPNPFTLNEVMMLLENAVPRTKLFLLLMLNCGMYQSDIADLKADEIDWKAGRIIRSRTKTDRLAETKGTAQPVKVNWPLWAETWRLFQEHACRHGTCFLNEAGGPLVTEKETTRNDVIRSAYRRLIDKLKRRNLLPTNWNKSLKQFRKTGSNLLQKSAKHWDAYCLYLNHSVARQHYNTSGEPVPSFDSAIQWLGMEIGVESLSRNHSTRANK